MGYEQYLQSMDLGPNWAHGRTWQKFWAGIGRVLDAQGALIRSAMRSRTPGGAVALGMSDALDLQGADRLLPRGGTDPTASDEADVAYAARLRAAWTTWGQHPTAGGGAGSVKAILTQLKLAGFPVEPVAPDYWTTGCFLINHVGRIYQLIDGEINVVGDTMTCVNRQNLDGTVSGTLGGWTLDARDQFYARFCLVFVQDVASLTNADSPAKARLNAICKRWKSGSAIYSGCAVVPQEDSAVCWGFPMITTWGQLGLNWGANGARFIEPE